MPRRPPSPPSLPGPLLVPLLVLGLGLGGGGAEAAVPFPRPAVLAAGAEAVAVSPDLQFACAAGPGCAAAACAPGSLLQRAFARYAARLRRLAAARLGSVKVCVRSAAEALGPGTAEGYTLDVPAAVAAGEEEQGVRRRSLA